MDNILLWSSIIDFIHGQSYSKLRDKSIHECLSYPVESKNTIEGQRNGQMDESEQYMTYKLKFTGWVE